AVSSSDVPLEVLEQCAEGASNGASAARAGRVVPSARAVRHQTADAPPQRPCSTATVPLTEIDHELLDAVGGAERDHAGRALLACGYRFMAGPIDLAAGGWPDTTFALLILRGSLTQQTHAATARMIAF